MNTFRFTHGPGSKLLYYGDEFVAKFSAYHATSMEEVFTDARGLKEVQLQLRLAEEHASTMARDFDASLDVVRERTAALERALEQLVDERDQAMEFGSQAYYLVTGISPEWSNLRGYALATQEIDEALQLLRSR